MDNSIAVTKRLFLSECGYSEHWLRDRIYDDPTILNLGELQAMAKEKVQSTGGRLDLLLKNSDDDAMFEVELQLGATDETHIIRTIEYWDAERRRWPKRSHTAVLIAEEITSRFYNVVRLLSNAVPIIGIAVSIVEVAENRGLNFTKIIDTYEEPEEEGEVHDEKYWATTYPWVLEIARLYRDLLVKHYGDAPIKYFRDYIVLQVGGLNKVWVNRRKGDRALLSVKISEGGLETAVENVKRAEITVKVEDQYLVMNVNLAELKAKSAVHSDLVHRIFPKHLLTPPAKGNEAHD